MFCRNCGKNIPDEAGFCPYCGTKVSMVSENKPEIEEENLNKTVAVRQPLVRQTEGEDFSKPKKSTVSRPKKVATKKPHNFTKKKSRGQTKYLAIGLGCLLTILTAGATVMVMKTLSNDGETQAQKVVYATPEESQTYEQGQAQTQVQVNQQNLASQQNVENYQQSTTYQSAGAGMTTTSAYQESVYQSSSYQESSTQESEVEIKREDFVFPDSDKVKLTYEELTEVIGNDEELAFRARNEIYARAGRMFKYPRGQKMFKKFKGTINWDYFDAHEKKYLSTTARENANLIKKYEIAHGWIQEKK